MRINQININHSERRNTPVSLDIRFKHEEVKGNIHLHYNNVAKLTLEEFMELANEEAMRVVDDNREKRKLRMHKED